MRFVKGLYVTLLMVSLLCYTINFDLYYAVGNMLPISGYCDFVRSLSDENFVNKHVDEWATSRSWVLREVHQFAAGETEELETVIPTQMGITFSICIGIAASPLLLVLWKRRKPEHIQMKKENGGE